MNMGNNAVIVLYLYPRKWVIMKIKEVITIILYPMKTDFIVENEHILIAEVVGDRHDRFYFAELPAIDNEIRRRLRYYENIVN